VQSPLGEYWKPKGVEVFQVSIDRDLVAMRSEDEVKGSGDEESCTVVRIIFIVS
jgi:hypothetical protein